MNQPCIEIEIVRTRQHVTSQIGSIGRRSFQNETATSIRQIDIAKNNCGHGWSRIDVLCQRAGSIRTNVSRVGEITSCRKQWIRCRVGTGSTWIAKMWRDLIEKEPGSTTNDADNIGNTMTSNNPQP